MSYLCDIMVIDIKQKGNEMPRPSTKEDLIKQAEENFEKLMELVEERGE